MPELGDLARRIAGDARAGEQVEAYVSWSRDTHVRAYDSAIETLSSAESAGVGVRVVAGRRQGFAYAGSLEESVARETLAEARDNASFASEDEFAGLTVPDGVPGEDIELWRDELTAFPAEQKTGLALELERRCRQADDRIRQVVFADYADVAVEFAVVSSTGIDAAGRRTRCFLSAEVLADDGSGPQSGYGSSAGRAPSELDLDTASQDATERALRMLGATKPAGGRMAVVFDRRVTSVLLSIIASALSGEEVAKGRSLFAGRVGENVAAGSFLLVEDPTNAEASGASTFDSEGLACRRSVLVEGGRLLGYLYDTRAGRMAGTPSTASAVRAGFKSTPSVGARALAVQPGELDRDEVLQAVGEGLFVQSVSGVHSGVNRVSGDFSVGAEGLIIRQGQLAEPVREITVASTIQRMLQQITFIGSDIEWRPGNACGVTMAIGEMAISGN